MNPTCRLLPALLLALFAFGCAGPDKASEPAPVDATRSPSTGTFEEVIPDPSEPAAAAPTAAAPELNASFLDPALDPAEFVARFERESREVAAYRDRIVAALGLVPGERVADIGAGTGLFLGPFVEAVGPGGEVHAVDISPGLIEYIRQRAAQQSWSTVTPVLCDERSTDLGPDSVDVAFVCDTYHHFTHPAETLASLHSALRSGGRLYVLDFERIPGVSREWLLQHVRAGKAVFKAEIEAAGFRFVEEIAVEGFEENYLLRFERP